MAEDWGADVRKYAPDAEDAIIAGIVRYCGIALSKRDSALVAFSDAKETGRVRENFLKKKLGLTQSDATLDKAIAAVGLRMKADRSKNRVTVYYLLAEKYKKLAQFAKASSAKAAAPAKAAKAPKATAAAGAAALGLARLGSDAKAAKTSKPAKPAKAAAASSAKASKTPAPAKLAKAPKAAKVAAPAASPPPPPSPPSPPALAASSVAASAPAQRLADAPAAAKADASGDSSMRWVLWLLLALLALFVLWWLFFRQPGGDAAAGEAAAVSTPAAASGAAIASAPAGGSVLIPAGAGVTSGQRDGKPVVKVYFATGKVALDPTFADASAGLKDYLAANPGTSLAVSGYNDSSGSAAVNAELSKNRAQAVAAGLVAAGIAQASVVLAKPEQTTDTAVSPDAARRVEVVVK